MTTQLQDKIAKLLAKSQDKKEQLHAEAEAVLHDGRAAVGTLGMMKSAKRDLTFALKNVERISDPELKELVKQRMLEIWAAPEVEEN